MVHTLAKSDLQGGKTLADMGGVITAQLLRETFSFEAYAMGAYGNQPVVFTDAHPVGYRIGPNVTKAEQAAIAAVNDRWADMKKKFPALESFESGRDDIVLRAKKDRRNATERLKRQMLKAYRAHIQAGGLVGIGKPGFTLN